MRSVPDYVTSAGYEAVELAASAGLHLDPWQQDVLVDSLGERADGKYAAFEVGLVVPRQNGKGPHGLSTSILTTDGWTTIGEIRPGQQVYGADGSPTRVVACSEVFPDLECFEVAFTDGSKHVVAADHLWHVYDQMLFRWNDIPTRHLASRFGKVRPDNGRNEFRYRVRCDAIPDTPEVDLPIDPYLLGYWLGDGSSRKASLTCGHEDLDQLCGRLELLGATVEAVELKAHGKAFDIGFRITDKWSRTGFLARARTLGILGDKHIPEVYLTASPKQRLALLAGLMDSDGSIALTNRSPQVEFTSSYPKLAATFMRLARSLGIRVTPKVGKTSLNGKECRPRTRFLWTPTFCPFEMPRKAEQFRAPTSRRHELMSITGIKRVPTVPTRCIQVDREDGVYLVGHYFTPTHNSILEARELFGLVLAGEQHILHSAHLFKTSRDAFRRILSLFQNTPDLDRLIKRISNTHGDEGIELLNGCRLSFVTRSKGGGRGLSGDVVILDEAYEVTGEQIAAILPTMISRPNPQVWYTSSPALDAVNGEALFALKDRGEMGEDDSLAWFDWGQLRGVDLDDPDVWAAANPSMGIRIDVDFLRKMRKAFKSNPEGFAREHLGIWPETSGTVIIRPALWRELADTEAERPANVAFAIDVTPNRDHAAIMWCGPDALGNQVVGQVAYGEGTEWVIQKCVELKEQWNPVAFGLDVAGPGGSLLKDLDDVGIKMPEDPASPQRGDLLVPSAREAAQAWGMFVDAARQKRLRHMDEDPLNTALAGAKTRFLADGQAWARRTSTVDISPLVAATLAHWTYITRLDAIKEELLEPSAFHI